MSLTSGTKIGPYEIVAAIGAGGMGEVYRATDNNLGRQVAIKILPDAFAHDPERVARFEREARTLASLNHPNIAIIHGLEKSQGTYALVMELVEGEDLSQRIARGPIPLDEALPIARQIADALEAAHEQGIIHRDLKPANIKVRPDGAVKVLDFGLAKLNDANVPNVSNDPNVLSLSPTITSPASMTGIGVLLGTAAYMAPEQAKGRAADKRSDVWAFGCVLYEMLTGRQAFDGEDMADVLGAVVRLDPDWSRLPLDVPTAVRTLLQTCLIKDRRLRVGDLSTVRFVLDKVDSLTTPSSPPLSNSGRGMRRWPQPSWLIASALALLLMIAFASQYFRSAPVIDARVTRFSVSPPEKAALSSGAGQIAAVISPDGTRVAFVANHDVGVAVLWVRSLDALEAEALPGTDNASLPFWSPDSRTLGFFAGGKLKTISADGGPVQSLCDTPNPRGGSWNREGVILFAPSAASGLFRIPAAGGQPTQVTSVDVSRGETLHRFPAFLPDGRHFVYVAYPSNMIWLGSLDSSERVRLFDADSQAQYVAPGYLLFGRQGTLFAQPFDVRRMAVTGEAMRLGEGIAYDTNNYAAFSGSDNGILAYRRGSVSTRTELTWVDRTGRMLSRIGSPGLYRNPMISPDGAHLAIEVTDPQTLKQDIWQIDLRRGVTSRFTFHPGNDIYPVWSPDGSRIVFGSDRDGGLFNLYEKSADGTGDDQRVVKSDDDMAPYAWAPDGRSLVYRLRVNNLAILSMVGERKSQPLLQSPTYNQTQGQVSPDGRWVAYHSNESGRYEVFARNYPAATSQWQISQGGGLYSRWRGDGKELFYYAADGRLMAVPVMGDTALAVGMPVPLFEARVLNGSSAATNFRAQYDVTRDGQRFLLNIPVEEATPSSVDIVLNWTAALKK